jgi:hypothetical protein
MMFRRSVRFEGSLIGPATLQTALGEHAGEAPATAPTEAKGTSHVAALRRPAARTACFEDPKRQ